MVELALKSKVQGRRGKGKGVLFSGQRKTTIFETRCRCGEDRNAPSKEIKYKRNERAIEVELAAQRRQSMNTIKRR